MNALVNGGIHLKKREGSHMDAFHTDGRRTIWKPEKEEDGLIGRFKKGLPIHFALRVTRLRSSLQVPCWAAGGDV